MPKIQFQTNVPVEVRLRTLEGKAVDSQFGGSQHMFVAEEGTFYVSEAVGEIIAGKLRQLRTRVGDRVEIVKAEVNRGNGRKGIEWQVAEVGYYPGEQTDGTLAVPALAAPPAEASAIAGQRKPAAIERTPAAAPPAWAGVLVDQTNALIDAYAAVLRHSARHEGLVKGDDVRSIFLSAFINVSKSGANGGRNAA